MLKIRRPLGRLIFNMGIAIPGKTVFLIETAPLFHRITCIERLVWLIYETRVNLALSNLDQYQNHVLSHRMVLAFLGDCVAYLCNLHFNGNSRIIVSYNETLFTEYPGVLHNKTVVVVVVTLFPTEKQSTAYMSKDTYVNQYTLMFCWWSPEKPKAYLAGNQQP